MGPKTRVGEYFHSMKYRGEGESFREANNRVASALRDSDEHYQTFREITGSLRFMPGGRIQSAMGAARATTPYNCYVSGTIEDSFVEGEGNIMERATQAAATMRMGGGIGYDFSTLRPRGAAIRKLHSHSSGPISFMNIFDAVCKCVASSGHRRGAQMGVMRVDHPDIEEFLHAKQNMDQLTGFNLSIAVTDEFMIAVRDRQPFFLRWGGEIYREVDAAALWEAIMRSTWDWAEPGVLFIDTINRLNNLYYCETIAATNPCFTGDTKVWTEHGHKAFKDLVGQTVSVLTQNWEGLPVYRPMTNIRVTQKAAKLVKVSFDNGTQVRCTPEHMFFLRGGGQMEASRLQPGMSIASAWNPHKVVSVEVLDYVEDVYCGTVDEFNRFFVALGTNDGVLVHNCGEQPLPPFGACLLGSFNLAQYVYMSASGHWTFDYDRLKADIPHVVRAMDNVVDRARYPLGQQQYEAETKRRMGLGVTGLANAGEALGYPYGSERFLGWVDTVLQLIAVESYRASALLAAEKGPFPLYDERYLDAPFIKKLPDDVRDLIKAHGIRNSHLTSIAPTGTISLCADNVSSGCEPVFDYTTSRPVNTPTGVEIVEVEDFGVATFGVRGRRASEVTAREHVEVLTTAQKWVDSAVSKTCNMDGSMSWEDFKGLYWSAWEGGAKGCTTFNIDGKRMALLTGKTKTEPKEEPELSCTIDPVTGRRDCA
jgi:ribonucleotide reductase alpha subunit